MVLVGFCRKNFKFQIFHYIYIRNVVLLMFYLLFENELYPNQTLSY